MLHLFFLSAPKIKASSENGVLYLAEPINACSPLKSKVVGGSRPPFALIIEEGAHLMIKLEVHKVLDSRLLLYMTL